MNEARKARLRSSKAGLQVENLRLALVGTMPSVARHYIYIYNHVYIVAPPVISWFSFAPVSIVISTINHSYWSYVHQLSYRTGASHWSSQYLRSDAHHRQHLTSQVWLDELWFAAPKLRDNSLDIDSFCKQAMWAAMGCRHGHPNGACRETCLHL